MKLWNFPAHQLFPKEVPFHPWWRPWTASSSFLLYLISPSKYLSDFKMLSAHTSAILVQTYLTKTWAIVTIYSPPIYSLINPSCPLIPDHSSLLKDLLLPFSLVSSILYHLPIQPSPTASQLLCSGLRVCCAINHSSPSYLPIWLMILPPTWQVCSTACPQTKTPLILKTHLKFHSPPPHPGRLTQ